MKKITDEEALEAFRKFMTKYLYENTWAEEELLKGYFLQQEEEN